MRSLITLQFLLVSTIILCWEGYGVHCRKAQNVIIVGAGAAGLAAAARLVQKHGLKPSQITILEAENRIGGRIHTVKYGSAVMEIGAQWCHGSNSIVYKLANPAGLLDTYAESERSPGHGDNVQTAYPNTGKILSQKQWDQYRQVADHIYDLVENNASCYPPMSVGAFFNQTYPNFIKNGSLSLMDAATAWDLLNWDDNAQGLEWANPNWFHLSIPGFSDYENHIGHDDYTWKNGYNTLFPQLLKNVPIDNMVRLNSTVTCIDWKPDGKNKNQQVRVTTSNNKVYQADVVLVTVSLGVLKEKANTLFNPPLPWPKTNAIKYLGFGTVAKIFLVFKAPWWNKKYWGGVNFLTAPVNRTDSWTSRVMGFYIYKNQPNVLTAWLSSTDTSFETMPEAQLLKICSKMLKGAIGKQFSRNYTEPIGVIRSSWYANPNFRGTYSYRSIQSDQYNVSPANLLQPEKDDKGYSRLFLAGEATDSHVFSTVNAAINTGYTQADNIAGCSY